MAAIDTLIEQISDQNLKKLISDEVARMKQQKKFGLVFEEHLPEATPLYDVPIKKKSLVAEKDGFFKVFYRVKQIEGNTLICETQDDRHREVRFEKDRMVAVAMFGEPIYPYLKPMDEVQNAPDSKLWHTLIEAENYHALQLLVYLYGGMVDCIYIDPPYNNRNRTWKYNNDYVDDKDSYKDSKWLSMMKKRLLLAKKLLNPLDSVLIVTIDEKEYLRLGFLLEELFPEAKIQMVSSVINPAGVSRVGEFSRTDEFLFFVKMGSCSPYALELSDDWRGKIKGGYKDKLRWNGLLRSGTSPTRKGHEKTFYPIFVSEDGKKIIKIGDPIGEGVDRNTVEPIAGTKTVWPIRTNGEEGRWNIGVNRLKDAYKKGYVRLGKFSDTSMAISYLKKGEQAKIENGIFRIIGKRIDGSVIVDEEEYTAKFIPGTQWWIPSHDATQLGTKILNAIIGSGKFEFPKSLYAVHDAIRFFTAEKSNALIVDFFAGSGTTLHAVNLLNAEDNGNRRCIMVTNNEVSEDEEKELKRQGYHPGDSEWERLGIAQYVNWPRTIGSIKGIDVNGAPLNGSYLTYLNRELDKPRRIKQVSLIDNPQSLTTDQKKNLLAICLKGQLPQSLVKADSKFIVSAEHTGSILFDIHYDEEWLEELDGQDQITDIYIVTQNDKEFKRIKGKVQEMLGNIVEEVPVMRPMSEGFAANAKYFKLGFLDKDSVELQRQFKELLPLLWMKAGAIDKCPKVEGNEIPEMLLLEDNSLAILTDEEAYLDFRKMISNYKNIKSIFIVTNSEDAFMSMAKPFVWAQCYQLYKDYLENFSINHVRQ